MAAQRTQQSPQIKIKIPDILLEYRAFRQEITEKINDLHKSFGSYTTFVIGVLIIGFIILLFALVTLFVQVIQFYLTFQNQYNEVKIQGTVIQNNVESQKTIIRSQQEMKKELDEIKGMLLAK